MQSPTDIRICGWVLVLLGNLVNVCWSGLGFRTQHHSKHADVSSSWAANTKPLPTTLWSVDGRCFISQKKTQVIYTSALILCISS